MFDKVTARFVLRAALVGFAVFVAMLQHDTPGIGLNDLLDAALYGVSAALSYAGVGAVVPQVEPSVGNKLPKSKR
jgi:hypothetical protein